MSEIISQDLIPAIKLNSGAMIPAIGMGTFGSDRFDADEVSAAVSGAIACGYRLFDCAACYGNEAQIGQPVSRPDRTGHRRRYLLRTYPVRAEGTHSDAGNTAAVGQRDLRNLAGVYCHNSTSCKLL